MEVLVRYSNHSHLAERLRKVAEAATSDPARAYSTAPSRKVIIPLQERLTEETVRGIAELYQAGESSGRLGEMYCLPKSVVLDVLRKAGVQVRLPRMSSAEIREAARLYGTGLSLAEVGKRMGRGYSTIHKALHRAGVRLRDTHGRP
ncbi:helix-turn-helix protein [Kribbella voronezhensis]|uniref:Helix-turn-helix protein n=2 Tax=Kribbella voronezhensis TaxID=2512212 RepID=A0A4R7T8A3_9ACTN|nr:helix-turn-helix protein [Kribbella voronezhensis]